MPTIRTLTVETLTARLPRPWAEDVLENHFIAVRVETDDGQVGRGFTWTPTIGSAAVAALLDTDIRRFVVGRRADPEAIWDPLWRNLHEAGSGGLTTIAMAGVDLALWDLVACAENRSVPERVGVRRHDVHVYGSGINRHLPLPDLLEQIDRWVIAGHRAVKIKVGGRPLAEDVSRVSAVRERLGADRDLMLDANQLWSLDEAVDAAEAFAPFNIRWLEEPLRADDLVSYRLLAEKSAIPLAAGENIHTQFRFREFLDAGVLGFAQPNVIRVGGITPFLRIAADAAERGVPVFPHLLPELSGQLAACLPVATAIEDVEDSSLSSLHVLAAESPVLVDQRGAHLHDTQPGLGLLLRTENHK